MKEKLESKNKHGINQDTKRNYKMHQKKFFPNQSMKCINGITCVMYLCKLMKALRYKMKCEILYLWQLKYDNILKAVTKLWNVLNSNILKDNTENTNGCKGQNTTFTNIRDVKQELQNKVRKTAQHLKMYWHKDNLSIWVNLGNFLEEAIH